MWLGEPAAGGAGSKCSCTASCMAEVFSGTVGMLGIIDRAGGSIRG